MVQSIRKMEVGEPEERVNTKGNFPNLVKKGLQPAGNGWRRSPCIW